VNVFGAAGPPLPPTAGSVGPVRLTTD